MTKKSMRKMILVAALGAVSTITAVSGAAAADDWNSVKGDIRWASASMGSTTQVLLSGVEAVLKGVLPNVRMSVLTTSGSVENPRLIEAGEAEFAGINADSALAAFQGTKPYGKPIDFQMVMTASATPWYSSRDRTAASKKWKIWSGARFPSARRAVAATNSPIR